MNEWRFNTRFWATKKHAVHFRDFQSKKWRISPIVSCICMRNGRTFAVVDPPPAAAARQAAAEQQPGCARKTTQSRPVSFSADNWCTSFCGIKLVCKIQRHVSISTDKFLSYRHATNQGQLNCAVFSHLHWKMCNKMRRGKWRKTWCCIKVENEEESLC